MLTLVCGLGRCGTSMVMQMLDAGGAPVIGRHPAYEEDQAGRSPISQEWLMSLGDGVVKVLDPHRTWPRQFSARFQVIWLDRNSSEQAKSQVKFLRRVGGAPISPSTWKAFRSSLQKDRDKSWRALDGADVMTLKFEKVLASPRSTAEQLATWFPDLRINDAASAVIQRPPECAPSMAVEAYLLTERAFSLKHQRGE